MGQYYKPALLGKNKRTVLAWVYSHDIKHTYTRADGSTFITGNGLKLMEHSWLKNDFVNAFASLIFQNPSIVVWGGDYAEPEKDRKTNTYERCKESNKLIPSRILTLKEGRYIINHSKNCFVDTNKVRKSRDGWRVHPLPLLTCEGNGQGGGDFRGEDHEGIVGSWARDLISVQPDKPSGFEEIRFNLTQD